MGTAACGDRNSVGWIFSDTWHFYKRPQGVENIAVSMNPDATGTVYTVVISWDPPVDFSGAVADIDSSVPGIPPTQGGYFVRYPCENSENEAEPGNFLNRSATQVSFAVGCGQSEQQFCVQVVDQSRLMTFIGAKSPAGTSLFSTPECPQDDTGG